MYSGINRLLRNSVTYDAQKRNFVLRYYEQSGQLASFPARAMAIVAYFWPFCTCADRYHSRLKRRAYVLPVW